MNKTTNIGNTIWFIGCSILLMIIGLIVFITGKNLPDFFAKPTSDPNSLNGLQPNLFSGLNDSLSGSSSAWPTEGYVEPGFYSFDYWLDTSDKYGKATLNYEYPIPQDYSSYKYVEFVIDFVEPNNPCYFYIESAVTPKGKAPILLNHNEKPSWFYQQENKLIPLDNAIVKPLGGEKYYFQIPLVYYSDIDLSQIKKVGIYIDTFISHNQHRIAIGNIHFAKE